jgi:hypothetical protein
MAININKSIKRLQQFQWIIETLKLYEGPSPSFLSNGNNTAEKS